MFYTNKFYHPAYYGYALYPTNPIKKKMAETIPVSYDEQLDKLITSKLVLEKEIIKIITDMLTETIIRQMIDIDFVYTSQTSNVEIFNIYFPKKITEYIIKYDDEFISTKSYVNKSFESNCEVLNLSVKQWNSDNPNFIIELYPYTVSIDDLSDNTNDYYDYNLCMKFIIIDLNKEINYYSMDKLNKLASTKILKQDQVVDLIIPMLNKLILTEISSINKINTLYNKNYTILDIHVPANIISYINKFEPNLVSTCTIRTYIDKISGELKTSKSKFITLDSPILQMAVNKWNQCNMHYVLEVYEWIDTSNKFLLGNDTYIKCYLCFKLSKK
jgi:hypothetical protein